MVDNCNYIGMFTKKSVKKAAKQALLDDDYEKYEGGTGINTSINNSATDIDAEEA